MGQTLYSHPDYKARRDDWIIYRDLYEGEHRILSRPEYLWLHAIERKSSDLAAQQLRASREERTRYLNLIEVLISLWCSYFFRKPPALSPDVAALLEDGDAAENIDGYGTSLVTFARDKLLKDALLYGKGIVLVDNFAFAPKNKGEEKASGMRPVFVQVCPLDAPDWALVTDDPSKLGAYSAFRHEYDLVLPRQSMTAEPQLVRYCDAYESTEGVTVTRYAVRLNSAGEVEDEYRDPKTNEASWGQEGETVALNLEEIPISVIDSESWVKDAAQEALRFHNLRSNYDNIQYHQGYERLFVKGVDFTNEQARKALSAYIIAGLPTDGDVLSIPPPRLEGLESAMQNSLDQAFRVGMNQMRSLPSDSRAAQSDDSQSMEKDNTYALVESTIEQIETCIDKALKHYAAFKGQANFDGHFELCDELGEASFDRLVEIIQSTRDYLKGVPTLDKAIKKKLAKMLNLEEEDLTKAIEEIESGEGAEQQEQVAQERRTGILQALNGRQEPTPPE